MNGVHFDLTELPCYRKKDLLRHMIPSLDLAKAGETITLPTLEGDVAITAGEDTYVMIGPCRDVYPITRQRFSRQYQILPGPAELEMPGMDPKKLRPCRLKILSCIYAKAVDRDFQVFVREHNAVITGRPGDFYAVSADQPDQPYIIQAEVMAKTYEKLR